MIVILAGLAAFAIAALIAWGVWHATRPRPHSHRAPGPPTGPTLREFLTELVAAHRKANGLDPEDAKTELWVDGLTVPDPEPAPVPDPGVIHGPHPPARRPQVVNEVLTAARVWATTVLRALPLDAVPHLRKGQYQDATGTFAAIAAEPPALHADESFSLTEDEVTAGLAQHAEDWGQ